AATSDETEFKPSPRKSTTNLESPLSGKPGSSILDHRLAPEHPFPAALDDAVTAYRTLLTDGANPWRMAVLGESSGGGLVLAMLLKLRDEGAPLPAAAVALSPWTDLALTGDSLQRNAEADPMLRGSEGARL